MAVPIATLNDGHRMPRLGLGTSGIADDAAAGAATAALGLGYRHIDTAPMYGNEAGLGAGIAASRVARAGLFLTTKLEADAQERHAAHAALPASLRRLGMTYVDLYLIHWPMPSRGLYPQAWRALIELRAAGLTRSIGVSNFTADFLHRIIDQTGVVPAANQIELHPRFQQRELRALHARLGIATICWSPLGRGGELDCPVVRRIAAAHGCAPAQVVLAWELQSGLTTIPKSTGRAHLAENLASTDLVLTPPEMQAINALDTPDGRTGPDPATFG